MYLREQIISFLSGEGYKNKHRRFLLLLHTLMNILFYVLALIKNIAA